MRLGGLLCIPLGHKWASAEEGHGAETLMRCRSCGWTEIFSGESRGISFEQRLKPMDRFGNKLP